MTNIPGGIDPNDYRQMFVKSFNPQQWFDDDDRPVSLESTGRVSMWVYRQVGNAWLVGFYGPDKEWHRDRVYDSREEAAERCHYLNGGEKDTKGASRSDRPDRPSVSDRGDGQD